MTQNDIKRWFEYEPDTGMLRRVCGGRKPYPWRGAGKDRRYLLSTINGRHIYLHQAVWLYHFGVIPQMIDHINGDTRDNRIENLRECTNAQNQYNSPCKKNNRSGFKGVVYRSQYKMPWQARITIKGKPLLIGRFLTAEAAAQAYADIAPLLVGEFARIN